MAYASLRSIRGQIITDFITKHRINDMHNVDISLVFLVLWRLFLMVKFITMTTVSVLFIYLHMVLFCEALWRLKYFCTIIKAEYEILFGLELLVAIGAIHIEAFGDLL